MKVYLTFALFLLCFSSAFAGDDITVSGTIKDAKGNAIALAMVAIENTSCGTYSDEHGNYRLPATSREFTLTASMIGYTTVRRKISATNATSITIDFVLNENSVELQSLQVLGKSKVQQVSEGAYAVSSIDVSSVTATLNNLNALINRTSGIHIREQGGVGSDYDLSVNGLSGNAIRYFVDGVPLSIMGNAVSLSNLPVNLVDRIEIYKGVVPPDLGADALGGAVNIITKTDKRNYVDATLGVGSFHTYKADFNARFTSPLSGIVYKPTLGFTSAKNDYTMKGVEVWNETQRKYLPTDLKRFHDGYHSFLAQLEAGVTNKRWADEFFLSLSHSQENKGIQTGTRQEYVYGEVRRQKQSYGVAARFRKNNFMVENLQANLFISHTWNHTLNVDSAYRHYAWDGSFAPTYGNETRKRNKMLRSVNMPLTIARAHLDYRMNENHAFSFNYLMNRVGNKQTDDLDKSFIPSNDVLAKHIFGLSYTQQLIGERLTNTFFLKEYINHTQVKQGELYWITGVKDVPAEATSFYTGYGAASRFRLCNEFALKASLERAIRLPLAREFLGNGLTIYPNFKLRPESSLNANLGIFGTWEIAREHRLYYETNLFQRQVKDYIRIVVKEADSPAQYENVDNVTVQGAEGEIRYDFKNKLTLTANASYLDERSKTRFYDDGKPNGTYNNRVPNKPWFLGNIDIDFKQPDAFGRKGEQLKLGYNIQYVHWFYLTWKGYGVLKSKSTIPTQFVNNAYVAYSLNEGRYNLLLECNNLFNQTLYDNYLLQKPGRSFFVKFRLFIH